MARNWQEPDGEQDESLQKKQGNNIVNMKNAVKAAQWLTGTAWFNPKLWLTLFAAAVGLFFLLIIAITSAISGSESSGSSIPGSSLTTQQIGTLTKNGQDGIVAPTPGKQIYTVSGPMSMEQLNLLHQYGANYEQVLGAYIPSGWVGVYQNAASAYGLGNEWAYLAALNYVETGNSDTVIWSGHGESIGPFQFTVTRWSGNSPYASHGDTNAIACSVGISINGGNPTCYGSESVYTTAASYAFSAATYTPSTHHVIAFMPSYNAEQGQFYPRMMMPGIVVQYDENPKRIAEYGGSGIAAPGSGSKWANPINLVDASYAAARAFQQMGLSNSHPILSEQAFLSNWNDSPSEYGEVSFLAQYFSQCSNSGGC